MREDINTLNTKLEASEKLNSDQVNSFNSKLEEKEGLLDKQITLLKTTTEDLAKAKGALVTSKDFLRMKEDKLVKLEKSFEEVSAANVENVDRIKTLENDNRKFQNENVQMSDELQISQKELTQKTAALTEKEEEIVKLKTLVDADESELKVRSGKIYKQKSLRTTFFLIFTLPLSNRYLCMYASPLQNVHNVMFRRPLVPTLSWRV